MATGESRSPTTNDDGGGPGLVGCLLGRGEPVGGRPACGCRPLHSPKSLTSHISTAHIGSGQLLWHACNRVHGVHTRRAGGARAKTPSCSQQPASNPLLLTTPVASGPDAVQVFLVPARQLSQRGCLSGAAGGSNIKKSNVDARLILSWGTCEQDAQEQEDGGERDHTTHGERGHPCTRPYNPFCIVRTQSKTNHQHLQCSVRVEAEVAGGGGGRQGKEEEGERW